MDLFLSNYKVGKPTEQEEYLKNLEADGYDDYEYFLEKMQEDQVRDMCQRCGIVKHVHVQKVVSGWLLESNRQKIVERDVAVNSKAADMSDDMPDTVKDMLIPSPNSEMQKHFNDTIRDVYEKSYHLFDSDWKFHQYATGQRQMRYDIDSRISELVKRGQEGSSRSKDGNWMNVKHFLSTPIDARNISRAKNTIQFLEEEEKKISQELDDIRRRRCHISVELEAWQVSEVQFYDRASTKLKAGTGSLREKRDEIASKVRVAERCVDRKLAKVSEEARKKTNKEANRRKEEREAVKRRKLQAIKVLELLGMKGEIELEGLKVSGDELMVTEANLGRLRPKLHSQGLRWLLDSCIFSEDAKLQDCLMQRSRELEEAKDLKPMEKASKPTKRKPTSKQLSLFPFKKVVKVIDGNDITSNSKKQLRQRSLKSLFMKPQDAVEEGDEKPYEDCMDTGVKEMETEMADVDVSAKEQVHQPSSLSLSEPSDEPSVIDLSNLDADVDSGVPRCKKTLKQKVGSSSTACHKRKGEIFRQNTLKLTQAEEELAEVINNPLPQLDLAAMDVDRCGTKLLPDDVVGLSDAVVLCSKTDGNCLFNSVSIVLTGKQELSNALRTLTVAKLMDNPEYFTHHLSLKAVSKVIGRSEDVLFSHAVSRQAQDIYDKTKDKDATLEVEARRLSEDGKWGSLVAIYALAEVIKRPIYSIYPNKGNKLRSLYHHLVMPENITYDEPVFVLWSTFNPSARTFQPEHFVPVVKVK